MIFEFQSQNNIQIVQDIFNLIPSKKDGSNLWFYLSILVLLYSVYEHKLKIKIIKDNFLSLLIATFIYLGFFSNTFGLVDEVLVNLEHPYNLYHFGKFSMSPDRMVDGTVEVLYYLLHTPFAQSQSSLVMGNFLISLIVGWLHLFVLWRLKITNYFIKNLILLSCFSLSFSIIYTFSSGFGNSLVSLLFLIAVYFCLKNQLILSLFVSGLLPLIRPDGILWSLINILTILTVTFTLRSKTKALSPPKKIYILMVLLPFISTLVYLAVFKYMYGHWIPTPILFKSVKLSMLPMFERQRFLDGLLSWIGTPSKKIALLVLASIILYLVINKHKEIEQGDKIRILTVYTLFNSLVFIFYNFTRATITDFTTIYIYSRYWVCFELTLVTLLLITISVAKISVNRQQESLINGAKFLPIFLMSFLVLTSTQKDLNSLMPRNDFVNRTDEVFAGALTEKILPDDFSISTSEMNTFGLMIDRPVIDIWGYTNRSIATSKVCNADKIRNNENFFLETLPDVYWPFWFTKFYWAHNYDTVETSFLNSAHTNKKGNLLGDMNKVLTNYDIFIIKTNGKQSAYFVRKSKSDSLISNLEEKGFKLLRTREIDMKRFSALYNSQKKVQYNCS
jgi:hypothetical protein